MDEPELLCMQRLALKITRARFVCAAAVNGIAHERVADRGEMHAYLMGATRLEPALEQCRFGVARDHLVMRDRRLATGDDRHARAADRVAPDRRFHFSVMCDDAVYHCG